MAATEEELKALASQLKHPTGNDGIEVANLMNGTNINMTVQAIDNLGIVNGNSILELGHGNAGHLDYLLKTAKNLTYYGLEMSELMHNEAKRINKIQTENNTASFHLYDGLVIPFPENSFDKILTVNTIYFWQKPECLLNEIYRVLKPSGVLNITFSQKSFMEKLPFTKFGFELYDKEKMHLLIENTSFKFLTSKTDFETVKSKSGNWVEREFTTVTLIK